MSSQRVLGIGLALSLALNVFLGGILIGRWLHRPSHGGGPDAAISRMTDRIAGRLPSDAADTFRATVGERRADIVAKIQASREAREAAREALRAQPFDPAKLRAAMAESRQRQEAMHKGLHDALADSAERMSADGRTALSNWDRRR